MTAGRREEERKEDRKERKPTKRERKSIPKKRKKTIRPTMFTSMSEPQERVAFVDAPAYLKQ